MLRIYRHDNTAPDLEQCFYVDAEEKISDEEMKQLLWFLREPGSVLSHQSTLKDEPVYERGPRLAVETPFSTRAVEICNRIGLMVSRVEMSMRHAGITRDEFIAKHLDPMTQEIYLVPLSTFDVSKEPEPTRVIVLSEESPYITFFEGRDPTDAAIALLDNALSEHCRHPTIKSLPMIDGVRMSRSIMEIVQEPWNKNPGNSLVAFHDNAGVMRGNNVRLLISERPGQSSRFIMRDILLHITITAETHNHPCFISPIPGAETGIGGELRDRVAQGLGALFLGSSAAGYCTSNLHIPGYIIPGEVLGGEKSVRYASALEALIGMSNGACYYSNRMGRPITLGLCRSFDQMVSGTRRGWVKPICYVGGVARVDDRHVFKKPIERGMLIIGLGGVARRIGVNGGAASSVEGGVNTAEIDLASVQRGDAITESDANRVFQAFAEMGDNNPVEDLSDQGAGGPGNLFFELVGIQGGSIDLEKIACADPSMSDLERLVGEYQERYGFLIRKENLPLVETVCRREGVNVEVLGEITGNGRFIVTSRNGAIVDLSIAKTLVELPPIELIWDHLPKSLLPLKIPEEFSVEEALKMVLAQPSVCSKAMFTRKGDRSVGGLVAQQQCCGPLHLPVADVSVMADSFFGITGSASALGEQPILGLINAKAGGRMAVAETLTNMCSALISKIPDIKCRVNEMWAVKQPGEGALLYDAIEAACELIEKLGFAPNGGKDSLSMAAKTDGGETVVAPGQLVVFGTAPMSDITKVVTPNFAGGGCIGFIDLGKRRDRLGGSAFAQALGQLGNVCPDIDDADLLDRALKACQQLIEEDLITAYPDRSDGGLIAAIVEMCIAGNRGACLRILTTNSIFARLFSQEAGMIFEYTPANRLRIRAIMQQFGVPFSKIGTTLHDLQKLLILHDQRRVLDLPLTTLRQWWEKTSDQVEMLQANPETVQQEVECYADNRPIPYSLSFTPVSPRIGEHRPSVAVIRAQGTNGDTEMVGVLQTAGFEVHDIAMRDILMGNVTSLDSFRGVAFPGGFADGDTFGSAKGWAGSILFNPRLREMFDRFYQRKDTFSLGVCNGCQLMPLIGWLPWQGIPEESQPRFVPNRAWRSSTEPRLESRWSGVKILPSPSIMLLGMEGSILGVWVAHGEGRLLFPDPAIAEEIRRQNLVPLAYVNPDGEATEQYPYNPNGSPEGWTALCSPCGRHLAMMPHPERCFLKWQWPWIPETFRDLKVSPWLQMFNNAYDWCLKG